MLLRNVNVLDPRDGSLAHGMDLLLDQGRILAVEPAGTLTQEDALVIDGRGATALPGLIDTHLHCCGVYLTGEPSPLDLFWVPRQILKNLRALVESGVTTIRDAAGPLNLVRSLRRLAANGRITSPRMLTPGPILTAPRGYPAFMAPFRPPLSSLVGQVKVELHSRDQARRRVRRLARAGVDFIKIAFTCRDYDDRRSPLPVLPDEVFTAVVEEAHRQHLPVAAHHIWGDDLDQLLRLPFDTLEHLPIDRPVSTAQVERIRQRNLPVSTTLMTYGIIDFLDEYEQLLASDSGRRFETRPRRNVAQALAQIRNQTFRMPFIGRRVIETGMTHMLASLRLLREAGVRAVTGTDSGGAITPCGRILWELRSFQRAGYSPLEVLRAATIHAARAISRPDLGVIAPGRPADVILCRSNPALDLEALERIDLVMVAGRVMKNVLPEATAGTTADQG